MNLKKLLLLIPLVALVVAFFAFDLGQYLTLEYIKTARSDFESLYHTHPASTLGGFFLVYVLVTALSLPGAAVMTLLAGALFGLVTGTVLVSFASTLGASLAFSVARYLAGDTVQRRFGERLKAVNNGIEKDGAFYLFTLRLVPVFPFFLINLLMGLTPIKLWTFYWVSQVGMLAGTLVYVNAGTQLAEVTALGDLLSPGLLGAFALLACFPWLGKAVHTLLARQRVYRGWRKPARFDRNLIVIGAGSAGLVTAYIAAAVKASVTLIEKNRMGGDCLNTGCVPSKALIRSASVADLTRHLPRYGLSGAPAQVDFAAVMQRVQRIIKKIEPHDSIARYRDLGVDVQQGDARLVSPWEVEITATDGTTQRLSARAIVIASGAEPVMPPIPGIDQVTALTSDTLWRLQALPKRLVVLGGGPIGCELSQAFAHLGAHVTQVEMGERLLNREDPDVSELIAQQLRASGVDIRLNHKAVRFEHTQGEQRLILSGQAQPEQHTTLVFDAVLVAVGRRARTSGLGLDTLGITCTDSGTLDVNACLQTRFPTIYACGDVVGPYQFTHAAAHQAWYAAVNALFGHWKKFRVDNRVMPWATFTAPEVARVGLNEQDAQSQGVPYEVTRYGIDDLDRAITDDNDLGYIKVLTVPGKDRILGVTLVAAHASELIAEYVLAMKHGIGLNALLGTPHIYPTMAEANKYAAGEWKRAHAPQRVLNWLAKYHAWRIQP